MRIDQIHIHVERFQFADDVDDLGVADVRHVLLEGQSHDQHPGFKGVDVPRQKALDRLLAHVKAHAVVHVTPAVDDLGVVTEFVGLPGEIVRVDADAVAADQAGLKLEKIPLGARRFKHLEGVDADAVKNDAELVDQGDVDVALGVLNDLGGLGHADAAGAVCARLDHEIVGLGHNIQGRVVVRPDHLHNGLDGVDFVTRVDALGAVGDKKVDPHFQPTDFLQDRHAVFFGAAGIHGALVHDHIALFQGLAHGA